MGNPKPTRFVKKRFGRPKWQNVAGIKNYDYDDNRYPNRYIDAVENSVTGTAGTRLYSKFMRGNGFNEDFAKYKIPSQIKRLTGDKLLRAISESLSYCKYFILHVNYNANYKAIEYTPIPFQYYRVTNDSDPLHKDMICIYDNWDLGIEPRIDTSKFTFYDKFNPDKNVIKQQIEKAGGWDKWQGQIYFFSLDSTEYPKGSLDPVFEDMICEGESKNFKVRNILTNFLAFYMLIVDKMEQAKNSTDPNLRDAYNDFIKQFENFQGAGETGKIMLIEKMFQEQTFDLKKVDIQDVEGLYSYTESSAKNNIIACLSQPDTFHNVQVAGKLGNKAEMNDSIMKYNFFTADERNVLQEEFAFLFSPDLWFEKVPTDDFEIITINAFENLTTPTATEVEAILEKLDRPTAKIVLKIFGFSEEQIDEIPDEEPVEPPKPPVIIPESEPIPEPVKPDDNEL